MSLTPEQSAAVSAMEAFLSDPLERFFVLEGPAGTGKTFCMSELAERTKGRLIFTAPTNKATKVLRDTITSKDYKPECRTIYSLLGLRMEANGELKELARPDDPLDLTKFKAIIVDEGSMVNHFLMDYIRAEAENQNLKFLFMGDRYQLPPVGEERSPIWDIRLRAELQTIMRFDNQILALSKSIRECQDQMFPRLRLASNNADGEGVWCLRSSEFRDRIRQEAHAGTFSKPNCSKAIAWRNARVLEINTFIRREIFSNADEKFWLPTDRITLTAPAKDLNDEVIATTDDEGTVETVVETTHPAYDEIKIWRLGVRFDDNRFGVISVLHADSAGAFAREKNHRAEAARLERRKWKLYWEFLEQFHEARHAYAGTAHRAQGSTYGRVFVDYKDILSNPNRLEAYKCLYVAATRPKKELYLA